MKKLKSNTIPGIIIISLTIALCISTIISFPILTNIRIVWCIVAIAGSTLVGLKLLFNIFPKWKWMHKSKEE